MTTSDQSATALQGWAVAQLDLGRDAAPAEVRAALLRRLAEDDFVPPLRRHLAARILLDPAYASAAALRHVSGEKEDRLRTEVDSFAADFFKLQPAARRQRWQELTACCAFTPPLAARVRELEEGLVVIPPTTGDAPDVVALAEHVCELFVLRPAARAARRQELLREMEPSVARWQAAARQLRSLSPAVAALAPHLLNELADWEAWLQQQRRREQVTPAVMESPSASSKRGSVWPVIVGIIVVVNLVRLGVNSTNSTAPPPAIRMPQPAIRTPPPTTYPMRMDDKDVQRILDKVHFHPTQQEIDRIMDDLIKGRPLSPFDRKKLEDWKNGFRAPLPGPAPPDPLPKSRP